VPLARSLKGKTPGQTLYSVLYSESKKADGLVVQVAKGSFQAQPEAAPASKVLTHKIRRDAIEPGPRVASIGAVAPAMLKDTHERLGRNRPIQPTHAAAGNGSPHRNGARRSPRTPVDLSATLAAPHCRCAQPSNWSLPLAPRRFPSTQLLHAPHQSDLCEALPASSSPRGRAGPHLLLD
jgi:hypothetical protein